MEIYLFKTEHIEEKLYAVENSLTVLNYAILGIKEYWNDADLDTFETVIEDAKNRVREIYKTMRPLQKKEEIEELISEIEIEKIKTKSKILT